VNCVTSTALTARSAAKFPFANAGQSTEKITRPGVSMRQEIKDRLRDYQREPTEHLLKVLRESRVGFDLSDTGVGKTFHAAAIASELDVPTLVIAPKVSLTAWERAAKHFGSSFSIVGWEKLRTGNTPFGTWENSTPGPKESRIFLKCQSCQCVIPPIGAMPCPAHFAGIHCVDTKVKPHRYGKFIFSDRIQLLIFDEIHRAAGDSLTAELPIAARRQNIPTMGLTATLATTPLHLRANGYLAGLHSLGNFYPWCGRFGCRRVPMRGIQWLAGKADQADIMRRIGESIVPRIGIRVTTKSIPDFPERLIIPELYDLPDEDTEEMNQLYQQLSEPLAEIDAQASFDVAAEHPLTKRLRARQRIEILKIPIAEELGDDSLSQGKSVVFFVNFQGTIDELFKRFPESGIINGQVTGKKRQDTIDNFQNNILRSLIINNQAGGITISLQDLIGDFPRIGYVFPCDSAVTMSQLFGRLARSGGRSSATYKVLFASRTVEVSMRRNLQLKLNNLAALTDDDFSPQLIP